MSEHTIGQSIPRIGARDRVTALRNTLRTCRSLERCTSSSFISTRRAWRSGRFVATMRREFPASWPSSPLTIFRNRCRDSDQPSPTALLADGETRFFGEPVAVVAAETVDAARQAAMLLREHIDARNSRRSSPSSRRSIPRRPSFNVPRAVRTIPTLRPTSFASGRSGGERRPIAHLVLERSTGFRW